MAGLFKKFDDEKEEQLKLGHLLQSTQDLAQLVEHRACGLESCHFTFDKGDEGQDSATVFIGLKKKAAYISYDHYGYLSQRNTIGVDARLQNYE